MPLRSNENAATLALVGMFLLIPALFLPFMSIVKLGAEESYSIIGSARKMFLNGHPFLATVVIVFSALFPLLKLVGILVVSTRFVPLESSRRTDLHRRLSHLVKYSMLDIFIVAILIVILKAGDMAEVEAKIGTLLLFVVIVVSALAGYAVGLAEDGGK